ncbi:GatB/YqeY domain-containing protein [Bacillus thuringiensis]|uniref:GatB/YqeY domain-containing protein n=1 Tax=Bacillus thuringiensis TaxID=1428 RepID=UPI000BFA1B24|nr:GatB/YqeY domain-containing protein [Bacillus thuringiensis]PES54469.1 hypothetical protein CN506_20550 [Bacillus thuringiensis]
MKTVAEIKKDMIQAMKDKDTVRKTILRMLLATMEKERIALVVCELNTDQIQTCIRREIKAVDAEIEGLEMAGRDTSDKHVERKVLEEYLPKQLTEDEIKVHVNEVVKDAANMGAAMKQLSGKLKGIADMGLVNKLVREAFAK